MSVRDRDWLWLRIGRPTMFGALALAVLALGLKAGATAIGLPALQQELADIACDAGLLVAALLWIMRRLLGAERAGALTAKLAVLAVTLVIVAVTGEQVTRFVFRNVTTTADGRSYFSHRWAASGLRENRLGFREREFEAVKPPGRFRIALIGDSFTYGTGVPERHRLSNLLDDQCQSRNCEVLNFGRPGNDTPEEIDLLRDPVLKLHPDFVLLQWFTNDGEITHPPDRPPRFRPLLPWPTAQDWLQARSGLFALLLMRWNELQQMLKLSGDYVDYMKERFGDPNRPDAKVAQQYIRDFIGVCQAQHVPVGIVLFPHLGLKQGKEYPFGFLHDQVLDVCVETKITCVDLRSSFTSVKDNRLLWASPFDMHPGLRANSIAATRVIAAFGTAWFR